MSRRRIREIVRNFPENGMKLLLEDPKNVRDLLRTADVDIVESIDFNTVELVKTTFVHRDYRHVEADVVLVASLRDPVGTRRRSRRKLLIYILIEHQSEPDRLILLRVLDYVVQILKYQERQWTKSHPSFEGFRLSVVLPVVFYTGTGRWASLGTLADLVDPRELATRFTPAFEPIFLNLPATDARKLEAEGGSFGWVLRLVQERKSRPGRFHALLQRAIAELEAMPPEERLRWLELLSYIYALIYHVRGLSERPVLHETIQASVQTDQHRQELFKMGKTIADELKEEGMREGESRGMLKARQQTLIRQLHKRFGEIPGELIHTIEATRDAAALDRWLDNVVTAKRLPDVGVGSAE